MQGWHHAKGLISYRLIINQPFAVASASPAFSFVLMLALLL